MSLTNVQFPAGFEYSSDSSPIPLEFYLDIFPESKVIYLKLGYFSSKAIQVLSFGFARFVANGGSMRIITNHFLYNRDKELLNQPHDYSIDDSRESLLRDIEWIAGKLNAQTQHVIDCLKLLVRFDRLEIVPVMLKPDRMAHFKQGVFADEHENMVFMEGSCNFTANGLIENAEAISVFRSWGSEFEKKKIESKKENIESILSRENDQYEYLGIEDIRDAVISIGRDKDIDDLLNDALSVLSNPGEKAIAVAIAKHKAILEEEIRKYREHPRFPFVEGPRDYQKQAYINWQDSGKRGIFAMATGTGKTITSINCLLNEYHESGRYQSIILVPSKALLNQWYEEVNSFNFDNVYLASSQHRGWRREIDMLNTGLAFDKTQNFIVIATYATFPTEDFQKRATHFPAETLFIADEAHNIGSDRMKVLLPTLKFQKRIALSATPKRRFDEEGNILIEKFFNSREPYTYNFSMERAISEGILCPYAYHPRVVYLTDQEMTEYSEISKGLSRLFDQNSGTFRNHELAKILLLERKRIVHKATNKLTIFESIVDEIMESKGNMDYSFVYVPEGEDREGDNLLRTYMVCLENKYPSVRIHHYISETDNRVEIMENFESGYIASLFSMKCLDEGVDIPRAETAIFCASTGNPRQFIQRRGRVLRRHKDKDYAAIHDLVVVPQPVSDAATFQTEKSLLKEELIRVIYFASLSRNYYESMEKFNEISDFYDLNMYSLEYELKEHVNA